MSENYYKILGLNENANKDEIKKAYRTLSFKYHPDKNNNSPDSISMTQKINEAYETLGDEQKREEYNMRLNNPFMKMNQNAGFHNMPPNMEADLNNIFSHIFMGPFGFAGMSESNGMPSHPHIIRMFRNGMQKPNPIVKTIEINMVQVLNGASIPIEIERWIIENENKIFENETIYVNIPRGIDEKEMIIINDKGNIINNNCKGDIKLFIKVKNDSEFERNGLDLIYKKTITLKEALCGFNFELKHLNGKLYTINNTSGNIITPGFKRIIPNLGLNREQMVGNLVIAFDIEFPKSIDENRIIKLRELL